MIWFNSVNKHDGRLLCEWWNANTPEYYFLKGIGKGRYQVIQQKTTK